jgi:hypothetical protein
MHVLPYKRGECGGLLSVHAGREKQVHAEGQEAAYSHGLPQSG